MKNKRFFGIIVTILLLLLIAGGIIAYIFLNKTEPIPEGIVGNTSGNINNRGLFCESDGYVYFSNSYDQRKLYRMNLDGTEAECIADVPCEFINVYDDTVYFYQTPGADNQVFGLSGLYGICSTDTKGKAGLNQIDKTLCNSLILYGPKLYYQHYSDGVLTLYEADARSNDKKKISDKRVFVSTPWDGKFLTYNEDIGYFMSLYNPATDQFELYDQDTRVYNVITEGNYVYYMNIDDSYRIYRMNLATYEKEKLTDDIVDLFNVHDGHIFYQKNSQSGTPGLWHMRADGSGASLVSEGNYTNINCTSTYTYFYGFGDTAPIFRVPTSGGAAETFTP